MPLLSRGDGLLLVAALLLLLALFAGLWQHQGKQEVPEPVCWHWPAQFYRIQGEAGRCMCLQTFGFSATTCRSE